VPPTLLFKNGVLRFAYTSAIFVPEGADPNDCLCCGESQCPVCDDYTYGETEVVLSGFPASFTYFTIRPIFPLYQAITVTGMDAINRTVTLSTDANCIWSDQADTINVTETIQNYSGFTCGSGSPTSVEVNNYAMPLAIGADRVNFSFGSTIPYRFLLKISDRCVGGTDSNFFALGSCPGGDTFTGTATWTPTLV
jgi:hypothetical protein